MEVSRHWRLKQQRYSLVGNSCQYCDAKIFPPRDICPRCGGDTKNKIEFTGKGRIHSYSVTRDIEQRVVVE